MRRMVGLHLHYSRILGSVLTTTFFTKGSSTLGSLVGEEIPRKGEMF